MNISLYDPQRCHVPNWPPDQVMRELDEDRRAPLRNPPERARYLESGWDEA